MSELTAIIEHLARLSSLDLTSQEKRRMSGELSDILQAAEKVKGLDTEKVEPTSHVSFQMNFREDQVEQSLPVNEVLKNAPRKREAFFEVPTIRSTEH